MTPFFAQRAASLSAARAGRGIPSELARLIEVVSHATGYPVADIVGRDRKAALVEARYLAAFEAQEAGFSHAVIARALGRDRSTIAHGIRAEAQRREQ